MHFVDEGRRWTAGPDNLAGERAGAAGDDTERVVVRPHSRLRSIASYPEAVRLFAEGRLEVVGRRVIIR